MLHVLKAYLITHAVVSALEVPIKQGESIALTPDQLGIDSGREEWSQEEAYIIERLLSAIAGVSTAELVADIYRDTEREFPSGMFEGVSVYLRRRKGSMVMYFAPCNYQFNAGRPG